ncbi:MAG: hypothetical protein DRM99_04260 [Thermoplasmata archaeon]|nr:MAG: hypothetical protein DRM99_04260 [Thermoplasmata archaeon]RLF50054.1 MAG: hypothetical protein DRN24_07210 [Thermoplasmata archaeon]
MSEVNLNIETGTKQRGFIQCAELEDGSPVIIPYFIVRGVSKKPVLLLNAAIHGEELNGIEVINRVFEKINPMELHGTIIGVPVVNTPAFRARNRLDPIDGKNLNRVFPGEKNGTTTERIAYYFFNKFVKKATFGIDLHTGSKGHLLVPHPRIRTLDDFTPVLEYPRALGTEFIFQSKGEKGMLNIEAGKIGIPIVCFEIGVAGILDEYYIKAGLKGVMNFMKYFGMIKGIPEIPKQQVLLKDYQEIVSQIGGLFYPRVKAGDVVKKNQLLGVTKSPFTGEKHYVRAPDDCYIVGIRSQPVVRQGTAVVWLMTFEKGNILPPLRKNDLKNLSSKMVTQTREKGIKITE